MCCWWLCGVADCKLVGARDGRLRYAQLDSALRQMGRRRAATEIDKENYGALSFRHAIVGRELVQQMVVQQMVVGPRVGPDAPAVSAPPSHLPSVVLLDASRIDTESNLCWLRLLDYDCDGRISESDFGRAVLQLAPVRDGAAQTTLAKEKEFVASLACDMAGIEQRWHLASIALEAGGRSAHRTPGSRARARRGSVREHWSLQEADTAHLPVP
jgi:hypothetical protein